eukprot:5008023-Lingulodinium_polyedra.AAC.1
MPRVEEARSAPEDLHGYGNLQVVEDGPHALAVTVGATNQHDGEGVEVQNVEPVLERLRVL